MKLVIQTHNTTKVSRIREYELGSTINRIKSNYHGHELTPLKHESFRFKLDKGIIVIYKDNKVIRSKNTWYEVRCLAKLAHVLNTKFFHSYKIKLDDGQETEIDGLCIEDKQVMVEIKRAIITQDWINYYESKCKKLNMRECLVIAPLYEKKIKIPPNIRTFLFKPDNESLMTYYKEKFMIPLWFKSYLPSRHIRILFNNGRWIGMRRQLTNTAKHTINSKFLLELNRLVKHGRFPIKIYYSLSPMLMPVEEYYGKGRPLPRVLAAIDVDADAHQHIIGSEGYCLECFKNSEKKAEIIAEKLDGLGWKYKKLFSGSKGFHYYLMNDKKNIVEEIPSKEFLNLILTLKDNSGVCLTDNKNFRSKEGTFDLHRIFKLPYSVDNSTGILVKEKLERISYKDTIIEL